MGSNNFGFEMTYESMNPDVQQRETGAQLHRREVISQIVLPFIITVVIIGVVFLAIALQADAIWRVRAAAIGDFLYTALCLIPMVVCSFSVYIVIGFLVIGINKLHKRTESPLRRVELVASTLANRIESFTRLIDQRAINWSARLERVLVFLKLFELKEDPGGKHGTE